MTLILVIVLTMIFAVLHSILARLAVKSRIRHLIGDRAYEGLYRIVYNAFSVITFTPIFVVLILQPGADVWNISGVLAGVFRVLQLIGLVGLVISLMQIESGRFLGTSQLRAYLNNAPLPLPDEPLRTDGLYGFVRHPLYLFSLMILWFTPSMSANWLVFVVAATLYFAIGSILEERTMLKLFGETYATYQQQVPWIIPFVK